MFPFVVLNPLPDPAAAGHLGLGLYGVTTGFCIPSYLFWVVTVLYVLALCPLSVHTLSRLLLCMLKNSILVVVG